MWRLPARPDQGERHAQEEDERRRKGSPVVVGPAGSGARHSGPARVLEEFGARHRRPRRRFWRLRAAGCGKPRLPAHPRAARSTSRSPCARTARSAAPSWPRCRTACGSARSPASTRPLNLGAHCAKGAAAREHAPRRPPAQISDEARRGQMDPHQLGRRHQRDRRQDARYSPERRARTPSTSWAPPSSPTSRPTCSASSTPSGAPTTATTRRASATPRPSRASRTRGATAP